MTLFRAEFLKLRRRPASYVVLGVLIGLIALFYFALAVSGGRVGRGPDAGSTQLLLSFPLSYFLLLSIMVGFGGLLGVTYGAAVSGVEWAWGTIRTVVGRGESRTFYVLVKFIAVTLMIVLGVFVTFVIGVVLAIVAATVAHVSTSNALDPNELTRMGELLARASFAITEQAAIGYAIATIFRSQLAGIGAGLAVYFAQIFLALVPGIRDLLPYFPFSVANTVVTSAAGFTTRIGGGPGGGGGGGGGVSTTTLDSTTAILFTLAYLVIALAIAAIATERAEITA